jgi:hypothetical protein
MASNTSTPLPFHNDGFQFFVSLERFKASLSIPGTSNLFPKLHVRSFKARAQNPVHSNLHVLQNIHSFVKRALIGKYGVISSEYYQKAYFQALRVLMASKVHTSPIRTKYRVQTSIQPVLF